ncbi:MAG: glycosyltransferase family 4 protein [Clostridiales bacterium]|nr:glycosyltransferase family 4 protein [Clostridiales bacterium]
MSKIVILTNNDIGLYKFRYELIDALLEAQHEVVISLPDGPYISVFREKGCRFVHTPVDRRGTNLFRDLKLIKDYWSLIRSEQPDVVLTYTVKPNVYGGLVCGGLHYPYIANITGLGSGVENSGLLQKIVLWLYKKGLARASTVFFQNEENKDFFIRHGLIHGEARRICGSGVNLERYCLEDYPDEAEGCRFLFVGRIMREKGLDELLECARRLHQRNLPVSFSLLGECEEEYSQRLSEAQKEGWIQYYGYQDDVHSIMREHHAVILPSYHEGMANVLLEAAASGRPVLASRIPGCREAFEEGVSGFGFEARSADDLYLAIEKFLSLSYAQKQEMGLAGRKKMECEFSREKIVCDYMEAIDRICSTNRRREVNNAAV